MMTAFEGNVMVNPVNDSGNFKRLNLEIAPTQRKPQDGQDTPVDTTNNVNLSDITQQITHLKQSIVNAPEVNKGRVEFIKEKLAAGDYQISSKEIAARMLAACKWPRTRDLNDRP